MVERNLRCPDRSRDSACDSLAQSGNESIAGLARLVPASA